ncbi:MAG: ATP-binding cassette domain-containing protein, partial [Bryobacteraceae bacterium]|nr:ATP-binding cassette domain-containing protein [Bryobacteraceae bacterium]
ALFEAKPEVTDGVREFANGAIEFAGVGVSHEGRPVLAGFSALVEEGSFCAVIGESGIGKSTIADLLVRLIDVERGAVRIGGVDVRDMRLEELRRGVVLVEQTPFLFHASVRENLTMGGGGRLDEVARELGIWELLDREAAGERGQALSAGERQRIGIARGLLRDGSVYVFDEPTAALDEANEAAVIQVIRERL